MFRHALPLPFKLLGIPVLLDWSFLVFLPILAWIIESRIGLYAEELPLGLAPDTAPESSYALGALCAVGLFLSVLIHELGHSVVAKAYGIEVKSITLWLLGGMAQFAEMPREKGREAVIGVAGPITSALLAGALYAVVIFVGVPSPEWHIAFGILAAMNGMLAIFNMIPALPLDGGRVLRSLLALKMGYLKATLVASGISTTLAFLLGFLGLMAGNVILVLVAFFVVMAGRSESSAIQMREALRGLRVSDVMSSGVESVYSHQTIRDVVARMISTRKLGFPVLDLNGNLVGVVSPKDLEFHGVDEPSRDDRRVADIMQSPAPTILQTELAWNALPQMAEAGADRLAVVDRSGALVGVLSSTDISRAVQIRMLARRGEDSG